jgi:hypothetical protein
MKNLARIALTLSLTLVLICLLGYVYLLNSRLRPPRKITKEMLHERLVQHGEEDAKNCGFTTSDEEDNAENRCALQALRERQPFIVQFRIQGIDSVLQRGFALNSKGGVGHGRWVLARLRRRED